MDQPLERASADWVGMTIAETVARRGTCKRRNVGACLTSRSNRVLSTGFNGVPQNFPHCIIEPEPTYCTAHNAESGTNLDGCIAQHAEANALDFCREPESIYTCYVTVSPCIRCCVALLNTPCKRIVFKEKYENHYPTVLKMWLNADRIIEQYR